MNNVVNTHSYHADVCFLIFVILSSRHILRTELFWVITQRVVAISYRRFRTRDLYIFFNN
jgi:hypothetical protein